MPLSEDDIRALEEEKAVLLASARAKIPERPTPAAAAEAQLTWWSLKAQLELAGLTDDTPIEFADVRWRARPRALKYEGGSLTVVTPEEAEPYLDAGGRAW